MLDREQQALAVSRELHELIEATERKAVAEERVERMLTDLAARMDEVCSSNDAVAGLIQDIHDAAYSMNAKLSMLAEFMAAYLREDTDTLSELQAKVAEGALKPHSVTVQATGEVHAGRDASIAGRDTES